nr:reverse transcriptase domain-containing protein [Tanacetum cinerariifolium]
LYNGALTWWNSHKRTVETDATYALTWKKLMNLTTEVRVNAARQADNKRKWENHSRDNHVHQQPFKRPNVARAYNARGNEKKAYSRNLPYCNKCKLHHFGPCIVKCGNCKKVGHMTRDCKTPATPASQRALVAEDYCDLL